MLVEKNASTLVYIFWNHWGSEYLSTLQKRRKLKTLPIFKLETSFSEKKELHQNYWSLALVIRAEPGKDGLVRKIELRTCKDGKPHVSARPVAELIMLVEG